MVTALQRVLHPFKVATKQLQGSGIPAVRSTSGSLSEVFPIYEYLLDHLEQAVEGIIVEGDTEETIKQVQLFEGMDRKTRRMLKVYIRLGWKHLKKYYELLTPVAYVAAVLFHPCKKWKALELFWDSLPSRQTDGWKSKYNSKLREVWERQYQNITIDNEMATPKAPMDYIERRMAFIRSNASSQPQSSQQRRNRGSQRRKKPLDELAQYLEEPPIENVTYKADPILWWRDVGASRFPRLSVMAVDYLTIPSSTAETERQFSSCGRMDTANRGRMACSLLSTAQCIRSWSQIGVYMPSIPLHRLESLETNWQDVLRSCEGFEPEE